MIVANNLGQVDLVFSVSGGRQILWLFADRPAPCDCVRRQPQLCASFCDLLLWTCRFGFDSGDKEPHQLERICAKSPDDGDELHHVDRAFAAFIFSDKRLRQANRSLPTAIVRSIIVMGRNLGLEVIAEGVETAAQANFLKAEGCHELRGYLISKPLPAEALEQVLQSRVSADSKRVQDGRRVGPAGR
jgi:hypothetical protein